MPRYICTTCGTQYAERATPPASCVVCSDDRQYLGWDGQGWTTHDELLQRHTVRVGDDQGLVALELTPDFGIGHRAAFVSSPGLNLLWESLSVVTQEAVDALRRQGGVDVIAISHPHFYTSTVEWSEALGGVPILLHAADRDWVQRPSRLMEFWTGERRRLSDDLTLLHCPGHFPGSTVLHWQRGPHGAALLTGDSIHVAADRRHISIMYSYPNQIPVGPTTLMDIRRRLDGYEFDDIYGFSWGRNIIGGGRAAFESSLARYLSATEHPVPGARA